MLGDNVFSADISSFVQNFERQRKGSKVLLKQVNNPKRYGVAELQGEKIISIEEKPEIPKSSYAITGIYMYDPDVFDIIQSITPSDRGELEITDVNNSYLTRNQLTYDILPGWWTDAGTFESLTMANYLAKDIKY